MSEKSSIYKITAFVNILVIIALPFFIYLGYKDGILSIMIICLIIFPFALRNAYRYFFDVEFRRDLNKYHDDERALPKEKRNRYGMYNFGIMLSLYGLALTFLTMIILSLFNLL